MGRGISERIDNLQLLDDRAGPSVRDDHRQRLLMLRSNLDEMYVESIDLSHELRQSVEPRLDFPPVVAGLPVLRETPHGREPHALGLVSDLLLVGPVLPGFEASAWFGVGAPRNTPAGIIERLNREINQAFADPKIKAQLAELGGMTLGGSPAEFGKLIADETEKWGRVIKFANIKPE